MFVFLLLYLVSLLRLKRKTRLKNGFFHIRLSKQHFNQNEGSKDKNYFSLYSWPLNQDVFSIHNTNPDNWLPINHSCNPNTWLTGLNLVARRDIHVGESITIDYLTVCASNMPDFSCRCKEDNCRGVISSYQPCLKNFITTTYGEHISSYVASLIRS